MPCRVRSFLSLFVPLQGGMEIIMKKIYKSVNDKCIAGVCGGIAEYFNIDSTIVRLIWAIFICFLGTGILAYILAAIIIPNPPEYL